MTSVFPLGFEVPVPPAHPAFAFEVLGPEHNDSDLAAWSTSIEHIRSSPGWEDSSWPSRVYSLEENLADLTEHRDHHERRLDFAWTVLEPVSREVIGCIYLRPPRDGNPARARSWVRADRAELDAVLRAHLWPWWAQAWPLPIEYARIGLFEVDDFLNEMVAAVYENAFLFELSAGVIDHLAEGLRRVHGPWPPGACSDVMVTWFDRGWINVYWPSEQRERWEGQNSGWMSRLPQEQNPVLTQSDARAVLETVAEWRNGRAEGFLCVCATETAPEFSSAEWTQACRHQ